MLSLIKGRLVLLHDVSYLYIKSAATFVAATFLRVMKYKVFVFDFYSSRLKCDGFDPTGVIGSGLSFIGGLVSNSSNKKIAREQMAQQEKLFNAQMDYTKEAEMRQYDYMDKAWQRENEYNDPIAQRERFERAGLNPAMMMEGQNAVVGSMGTPSSPSVPGAPQVPSYQFQDPITPAVNTYLQSRLLNSQVDKNEQDSYQMQIDNRTRAIKNIGDLFEIRSRIAKNLADAKKAGKDTEYIEKQINYIDNEIDFQQRSLEFRVSEAEKRARLVGLQGDDLVEDVYRKQIDNAFLSAEKILNFEIAKVQKRRLEGLIYLDDKQAQKLIAETAKEWLLSAGLTPGTPQWEQKERELQAIIDNARRVHLPFGISLPDNYSPPVKNSAKNGKLW